MENAVRPYAAMGTALLAAGLIAVIPAVAPTISAIHVQSPAVELTATADAFLDLANALDPSASTDGLIGVANSLDSYLDLFGTPTVNVADSLATDFIGFLDLGSSVNSIPSLITTLTSDLTAGFTSLETGLSSGLSSLDFDLGNDLGYVEIDFNGAISTLDTDLSTSLGTLDTSLGTLDTDLGSILTALGPTGEIGIVADNVLGVSTTLENLFGNGSEIVTLLGYLTYLPGIEADLGGILAAS
jgi:hypothetical protein